MKKILISGSVILAAIALVFAAEEKSEKSASPSSATSTSAAATSAHKVIKPSDIQWGEGPPGLPPGVKMAVLDGDPGKPGSFTIRLKTPAGYKIAPHTHPTAERVTGISGTAHLGMGEKFDQSATNAVAPGTFVLLPAGMAHFVSFPEESIVQVQSEGPFQINYINPADDPRNKK